MIQTMFIDRFIEIGFKQIDKMFTSAGCASHFKYYPSYLIDKHYTLVTFSHGKEESLENCEYRLYVHNNVDGSYADSIFQTTYKHANSIKISNEMFDETFKQELKQLLRTQKLNTLI